MLLSKFSFIIPEKNTAILSMLQKEYEAKKKHNFIVKWTFEFLGLFHDEAADEMFWKTCSYGLPGQLLDKWFFFND